MIAGFVGPRCVDVRVVSNKLGRELIGFRIQETIESVETSPKWPTIKRATGAGFRQPGHMPFSYHVVSVAVRPQQFGQCRRVRINFAAVSRKAAIKVGERSHSHRMMVLAGVKRSTRRRAHCCSVEAGKAEALFCNFVDVWGVDL